MHFRLWYQVNQDHQRVQERWRLLPVLSHDHPWKDHQSRVQHWLKAFQTANLWWHIFGLPNRHAWLPALDHMQLPLLAMQHGQRLLLQVLGWLAWTLSYDHEWIFDLLNQVLPRLHNERQHWTALHSMCSRLWDLCRLRRSWWPLKMCQMRWRISIENVRHLRPWVPTWHLLGWSDLPVMLIKVQHLPGW